MDRVFFEQLGLPEAEYNLNVGSGTHGEQTGKMLIVIEKVLQKLQTLRKLDQNASLNWENPFGDGKAGKRIVEILMTQ